MNYYTVARSNDLKETGYYPQTTLKDGYNPRQNGHWEVKINEFPDFVPNLEIELNAKAIPTDYLHFGDIANGIIVSKRMMNILKSYNLPRHHFYPIKVYHIDEILDYYWLHFIVDDFWESLDRKNSWAEIAKLVVAEIEIGDNVPIISEEQIKAAEESYKFPYNLRIGQIRMKSEFANFDLYKICCLSYNILISERLLQAMINKGLTGFEAKFFPRFIVSG